MDLVERVGAYVGLAAFLGLAILALLYFSQARDVRRLREWAGRAPDRAADAAATRSTTSRRPPIEQCRSASASRCASASGNIHIPQCALHRARGRRPGGARRRGAGGASQLTGEDGQSRAPTAAGRLAERPRRA